MVLLSITGLIRMILIIGGVFLLLRFIGRLMIAKRAMDEQNKSSKADRERQDIINRAQRDYGKTTISRPGKSAYSDSDYTDYEEVKEED